MIKVWALQGLDGEIYTISEAKETLEKVLLNPLMFGCELIQIDYNDDKDPQREAELTDKLREVMKGVRKFHMNKQVGFFAISFADRLQFILDMFDREKYPRTPLKFNDSRRKEADVDMYTIGQWKMADDIMNWINTLEDKFIEKSKVYNWAFNYKPESEQDRIARHEKEEQEWKDHIETIL